MRGRVGSTVLRKGQRAVVASQYQPQVANPMSAAQAVQRCSFATAAAAMKALYSIVDHSFESVSGRRDNLQRFMRLNVKSLATLLKSAPSATSAVFNLKGVPGIQLAPFVLSEGSLTPISSALAWSGSTFVRSFNKLFNISSQAAYAAALKEIFGCDPGDQITMVAVKSFTGNTTGQFGAARNVLSEVVLGRLTFVAELPAGFAGSMFVEDALDERLIEESVGSIEVGGVVYEGERTEVSVYSPSAIPSSIDDSVVIGGVALIRSKRGSSGFQYSTARLQVVESAVDMVGGDYASAYVGSYQQPVASFASDYYLDNAV